MNKLNLSFVFLFVGCMVQSEFKNVFDPKSLTGILLSSVVTGGQFECNERSNTKSFGHINQILLQCNRELAKIDTDFLSELNESTFTNVSFAKIGNDQILIQFDPLMNDGSYEINLKSVVSGFGETLTQETYPIVIDTQLPAVSLTNYLPITDYTFFTSRYWDFESSEPLKSFGQPLLSGSLASMIVVRSIQKISDTNFRVYFETNFDSNGPGSVTISFPNAKDKALNDVTNSITVRLIGLVPGPTLNQGRAEFEAFQNENGDVIAIYGYNSSAEILRRGTNSFILTNPSLPEIHRGERGVMLDGKKLLITGGIKFSSANSLNESYLFDTETTSFLQTGSMVQTRHMHDIVKLPNGKVMVIGGIKDYTPVLPGMYFTTLNSAEIYDPATETFTEITNRMMSPRSFSCSVVLNDGRVFIVGGTDGIFAPKDTTEFYDPATETFSWGPSLPIAVGALKCLKLTDGNVLIYGAQLSNLSNATMLFDISKNRVLTIANSLYRREWSMALELPDGGVLFYGGAYRYNTSEPSRTIEKLDYGKSNSFYEMGMSRISLSKHSGVKFSDGTFFFLGGESGGLFHHGTDYYGLTE
ncbi:kelch-like protein [Leptospira biflexa]|uniref:Kelch repeat-containing protein n=1 Tax=Leptospira biflexa TaxID=172 RepID=UPI001090CC99|nr:kelch repeat-containing protein [Leptospira biflexa]TGM42834.1 kelch-like protein [Leptospira biflexa]TGM45912.1 kelch-like protein [Leptospira biflexa]